MTSRISAENPTRNHTAPSGPMCANRCLAIAALSCVETTASTTSAGEGKAPSTGVRSEVAGVEDTAQVCLRSHRNRPGAQSGAPRQAGRAGYETTGLVAIGQNGDDPPPAARREVHAP